MDKVIFALVVLSFLMVIVVVATLILHYVFNKQNKQLSTRKGGGILLANLINTDCSIREADKYMKLTNSVGESLNVGVKND